MSSAPRQNTRAGRAARTGSLSGIAVTRRAQPGPPTKRGDITDPQAGAGLAPIVPAPPPPPAAAAPRSADAPTSARPAIVAENQASEPARPAQSAPADDHAGVAAAELPETEPLRPATAAAASFENGWGPGDAAGGTSPNSATPPGPPTPGAGQGAEPDPNMAPAEDAGKERGDWHAREPRRAEEMIAYWHRLRGNRRYPAAVDLDRQLLSGWPDSMILAFDRTEPAMPRISRLGEPSGAIEYTTMVTEWLLSQGRHAARRGAPIDEEQQFPIDGDHSRYRLVTLPLAGRDGASDSVLCLLCRAN